MKHLFYLLGKITFVLLLVVGGKGCMFYSSPKHNSSNGISSYDYIITHVGRPDSHDPLDADKWQNMDIMRMRYLTPLEISPSDQLTSTILEDFSYDPVTATMTWRVKEGLSYQDNSPITVDDVAFSVARMLFVRPKFPVISDIAGKSSWLATSNPLKTYPSGITIEGHTIKIVFDKAVPKPFFRFTLELFSIIPRRCVDVTTNKLTCERPPESGHYYLADEANLEFILRRTSIHGRPAPQKIRFIHKKPSELEIKNFNDQTVAVGREDLFAREKLKELEQHLAIRYLAATSMGILQLNSNIPPFDKSHIRFCFAEIFRRHYQKINSSNAKPSRSILTSLVPGHLPDELLITEINDELKCKEELKRASSLTWYYSVQETSPDLIAAISATFQELGNKNFKTVQVEKKSQMFEAFKENKSCLVFGSTGFWPLDPENDLQMLLTPHMHPVLKDVANDSEIRELLDQKLARSAGPEDRKSAMTLINRYLYKDAKFNNYVHLRALYVVSKLALKDNYPLSVKDVGAAPWEVFTVGTNEPRP